MSNRDPRQLLKDFLNGSGGLTNDCLDSTASGEFESETSATMTANGGNNRFYQLLGVSQTASESEIKRAYRKKAREIHPDRNQSMSREDAESAFHDLCFAYETLKNKELRTMYDRFGESAIDGKLHVDITKINLMELFDSLYDENDAKNDQIQPPKIVVILRYDQFDLSKGRAEVSFEQHEMCTRCNGKDRMCAVCDRNGYTSCQKSVPIILNNDNLKDRDVTLRGKGHVQPQYSQPGDLMVRLRYRPQARQDRQDRQDRQNRQQTNATKPSHGGLQSDDNNFGLVWTVSLKEAIFGVDEKIFLPSGGVALLQVKGPIQSGQQVFISLDGNGSILGRKQKLCVTINVEMPDVNKWQPNSNGKAFFKQILQQLHVEQQGSINQLNAKQLTKMSTNETQKKRSWGIF